MIKLFGVTDTTFTTNGDKVIVPLKAKIHKEDNGDFYLDLEAGLEYVNCYTAEDGFFEKPGLRRARRVRGLIVMRADTRSRGLFIIQRDRKAENNGK